MGYNDLGPTLDRDRGFPFVGGGRNRCARGDRPCWEPSDVTELACRANGQK